MNIRKIKVYDFFSGCGGASLGLQNAGMEIVLGIDNDKDAISTFSANLPNAKVICKDIRDISLTDFKEYFDHNSPSLFAACAPCQPFSQIVQPEATDKRINLLLELLRFVERFTPEYIFLENVPGAQTRFSDGPFTNFTDKLKEMGYSYNYKVIEAQKYGVPQKRSRLILLASKRGSIRFPKPTHGYKNRPFSSVKRWIGKLPAIQAGETDKNDVLHRSSSLSEKNLERIASTPPERGRETWREELLLNCHKGHLGHSDVYGRMKWDRPASTLTTRCISLSNGRFGHPEQNRAISLREAALLQTFPSTFTAFGSDRSISRQIGNAVPPLLAQKFGKAFLKHNSLLSNVAVSSTNK